LEPEVKASPTVTVDLFQAPEDLEAADDLLNGASGAGQFTILGTLFRRQGLLFGGLMRRAGTRVFPPDPLIPRVCQQLCVGMNARL
jgi:hypothetical protein